jgi:Sulfotransferase family
LPTCADPASAWRGDSPIFVVGVAHSGTTILHRMLAYHPGLAWFSQFSLRGGEIPGRSRIPGAGLMDRHLRSIPHRWQKQKPRLGRPPLTPRPGEAQAIWADLINDGREFASVEELDEPAPSSVDPKRANATIDADRLRSRLAGFSKQLEGRRVLAKLPPPDFYRFLEPVQAALPGALFVHIVRDGRAVAFSLRPKFERRLDARSALLAAARHWVVTVDRVQAARETDSLELRYEDLCEDVHGVIRTILDRAALDPEAFPFQRCPSRLAQTNSRWLDQALPEELEEVTEIQREQLNRFGYPPLSAPAARVSVSS